WPLPRTTARTKPRDSKAPMSGARPRGRATPRWSVVTPGMATPASRAGLPGRRAWAKGGPPWSASGPSRGSASGRAVRSRRAAGRDGRRVGEEVVPRRGDGPPLVDEVAARAVGEEAVDERQPARGAVEEPAATAAGAGPIAAEGGAGDRQRAGFADAAAAED